MAEEFNPNAFRQQMAQNQPGQVPLPQTIAQQQAYPQAQFPQAQMPMQAPQGGQPGYAPPPQNYAPTPSGHGQHPDHQQGYQQPANFRQAPQQMPQSYSQGSQNQGLQNQAPHMQAQTFQGHNPLQGAPVQKAESKKGLFKRKKLKNNAPQMPGRPNIMAGAEPMAEKAEKSGLSRLIVFVSGLGIGVLGTLLSIMLFSSPSPQTASLAVNDTSVNAAEALDEGTANAALTDEMLLTEKAKDETP